MVKIAQKKKPTAAAAAKAKSSSASNSRKAKNIDLSKSLTDEEEEEEETETPSNKKNETKSTLLSECKSNFGSQDLYEVLSLDKKSATQTDIKKAYYKFSLKYHPDKVTDESLKEESTIKFQILGKVYSILSDEEKKKLYDDCGVIDGEDNFSSDKDWDKHWRQFFKLSTEDIKHFFDSYKSSEEEKADLFRIYEKCKGDMNLIMEEMFSDDVIEDEPRFKVILENAIEEGTIGKYAKFTSESKRKATKRKAHYEKEAKEAEEMKKQMGLDDKSLETAIMSRMSARKVESDSFLSQLEKKYAGKEKISKKKPEPVFKLDEVEVASESEESSDGDDNESDEYTSSKKVNKKAKNGRRLVNKAKAKGREPIKRLS